MKVKQAFRRLNYSETATKIGIKHSVSFPRTFIILDRTLKAFFFLV